MPTAEPSEALKVPQQWQGILCRLNRHPRFFRLITSKAVFFVKGKFRFALSPAVPLDTARFSAIDSAETVGGSEGSEQEHFSKVERDLKPNAIQAAAICLFVIPIGSAEFIRNTRIGNRLMTPAAYTSPRVFLLVIGEKIFQAKNCQNPAIFFTYHTISYPLLYRGPRIIYTYYHGLKIA